MGEWSPLSLFVIAFEHHGDGRFLGRGNELFCVRWRDDAILDSKSDPGPLAAGTHALSFFSIDAVGNAESTQTVTVVIDTMTPAAPLGLAARFDGSSVNLTWAANQEIDLAGILYFPQRRLTFHTVLRSTLYTDAVVQPAFYSYVRSKRSTGWDNRRPV